MAITIKKGFNIPQWEQLSPPIFGANVTGLVSSNWFAEDMRNNDYAHPVAYLNTAAATVVGYNFKQNAWGQLQSAFGAGGNYGSGSVPVFSPALSPSGTLAAGGTTTTVILSTALPATVTEGQLADRGDGKGFIIRIINKVTGIIEERRCIDNTSGTTPTIKLDAALATAPNASDGYEFLSGSYLFLGTGALAAAQWRRLDLLTLSLSSLVTTNLIATVPATTNLLFATDEAYVSYDRLCGEGYLGASTYGTNIYAATLRCLTATASAATTITGTVAGGDSAIPANQYRNYQVRIVEDTGTPTAVGQRRRIISHTAGASPIYTISSGATNWTVTPSATCKFVVENWTDNIIASIGGTTTMYNYTIPNNYTGVNTANLWDTTTWAVKGTTTQTTGAFGFHSFGIVPTTANGAKASNIFTFRGGSNTYDLFDFSGAATGSWTNALSPLDWSGVNLDAISASDNIHACYNPHTEGGRNLYLYPSNNSGSVANQRSFVRFDGISRKVTKYAGMKFINGSAAYASARWAFISLYQDTTDKLAYYNTAMPLLGTTYWRTLLI